MRDATPETHLRDTHGPGDTDGVLLEAGGTAYRILLPDWETDYIQGYLASTRTPYEAAMLEDMASRLLPGQLVLDVGAYVGNHTLYLAAVARCRVIALEPQPGPCRALQQSVERNGLQQRVVVHNMAAGSAPGRGELPPAAPDNLGAQAVRPLPAAGPEDAAGDCDIVPLDTLELPAAPAAIKVDVEGMELAVLQGARHLLQEHRPLLYVECATLEDFAAVNAFLVELGYGYWATFNATPTHLFVPPGHASAEARLQNQLTRHVRDEYELRRTLNEARSKYRDLTQSHAALQQRHEEAAAAAKADSQAIAALEERLRLARQEEERLLQLREDDAGALERLRKELDEALHQGRGHAQQAAARAGEAQALRQELERLGQQLQDAAQQARQARDELQTLTRERDDLALQTQRQALELDAAGERQRRLQDQENRQARELDHARRRLERQERALTRQAEKVLELRQGNDRLRQEADRLRAEESLGFEQRETELRQRLQQAETRRKGDARRAEALQHELDRARADDTRRRAELDETRRDLRIALRKQELQQAENAALRRSVSFMLGQALVQGVSSWKGALRLPLALGRAGRQGLRHLFKGQTPPDIAPERQSAPTAPLSTASPSSTVKSGPAAAPAPQAAALPEGSPRVACILDDFSFQCFAPECALLQLHPDIWERQLREFAPELLLVESAWQGVDGAWSKKVGQVSDDLRELVAWCRQQGIPTAFWNKEDPVHFGTFLNAARLFRYVFTTDIDCIPLYKRALEHDRVHLLPFACQPRLHNPVEKYERKDAVCFAGAYYARYPERARDLERFVDALSGFRPVEIFDRNLGKNDPNYAFPEAYRPFIRGTLPFSEIDRAYKGYVFALNLNSIKQSQSMFARRVFELLASGAIVVSNHSPGMRLLFGDLTLCSDDAAMLVRRLQALAEDPERAIKLRTAAQRKVLTQHTSALRLRRVQVCAGLQPPQAPARRVAVLAMPDTAEEARRLADMFQAQSWRERTLLLVLPESVPCSEGATHISPRRAAGMPLAEAVRGAAFVACWHPQDHYGPHYLTDLLLAADCSGSPTVGKASRFVAGEDGIVLQQPGLAQRPCAALPARCSVFRAPETSGQTLLAALKGLDSWTLTGEGLFGADPCSYCQDAARRPAGEAAARVDDAPDLDTGMDMEELYRIAEAIPPATAAQPESALGPQRLAQLFGGCGMAEISIIPLETGLALRSDLPEGQHRYIYAPEHLPRDFLGSGEELCCHFETTPGLATTLTLLFLDEDRQRIGHAMVPANQNVTAPLTPGTRWLRVGIRIFGPGGCELRSVEPAHRNLEPAAVLGRGDVLLVTNHYPSRDDLYRNGFVHSRVTAYRRAGLRVDVFCLRENRPFAWHEFEDVDVAGGTEETLRRILASGRHRHVLVHFLNRSMWRALRERIENLRVTVWVHGAEIQPWWRRDFDPLSEEQREAARRASDERLCFWRELLQEPPANLHLVFVSRYFAEEVQHDLGLELPASMYSIIHNPVDTDLFRYEPKTPKQRGRILSIRPFASAKYANDLSVQAILLLAQKPFFQELRWTIVGDGRLFEETVAPLLDFENVEIRREFLRHEEIARLHRSHGVFLCPTRCDSQGVSRDEAMASGLVPVTSDCSAIPEFVDAQCGILAPPEEAAGLAEGIERLWLDPELFLRLSQNAATRARSQVSGDIITPRELELLQAK